MATQKIKLKAKNGGAEISVTPSAYQMRKSKYDATHTIVKETPRVAPTLVPPIPPMAPIATEIPTEETAENSESQELDAHEEPATKERKKPGPKPKNQDA